jgi:phosphinothricin acetyltransferase
MGKANGFEIRAATAADLPAINDIFNHYVATSPYVYALEPVGAVERADWFRAHGGGHPILVAHDGGGVIGWGALSPFNARGGYRHTVEDSLYVHPDAQRRGAGRALLATLMSAAERLGHHAVLAIIDAENKVSIALHERFGFATVAVLHEVGHKHDRWRDVVYLERLIPGATYSR